MPYLKLPSRLGKKKRLQNKIRVRRPSEQSYEIISAKFMFSLDLVSPNKSSPLTLHFSKLSRGQLQDAKNSTKSSSSPLLFHKLKKNSGQMKYKPQVGKHCFSCFSFPNIFLKMTWLFLHPLFCCPRHPVLS